MRGFWRASRAPGHKQGALLAPGASRSSPPRPPAERRAPTISATSPLTSSPVLPRHSGALRRCHQRSRRAGVCFRPMRRTPSWWPSLLRNGRSRGRDPLVPRPPAAAAAGRPPLSAAEEAPLPPGAAASAAEEWLDVLIAAVRRFPAHADLLQRAALLWHGPASPLPFPLGEGPRDLTSLDRGPLAASHPPPRASSPPDSQRRARRRSSCSCCCAATGPPATWRASRRAVAAQAEFLLNEHDGDGAFAATRNFSREQHAEAAEALVRAMRWEVQYWEQERRVAQVEATTAKKAEEAGGDAHAPSATPAEGRGFFHAESVSRRPSAAVAGCRRRRSRRRRGWRAGGAGGGGGGGGSGNDAQEHNRGVPIGPEAQQAVLQAFDAAFAAGGGSTSEDDRHNSKCRAITARVWNCSESTCWRPAPRRLASPPRTSLQLHRPPAGRP